MVGVKGVSIPPFLSGGVVGNQNKGIWDNGGEKRENITPIQTSFKGIASTNSLSFSGKLQPPNQTPP